MIDLAAITRTATALRTGRITADQHPARVADLLDALSQAITDQRAHIDELERTYATPATQAAQRTEYARGFRDAQAKIAAVCDPEAGDLIYSFTPSFVVASDGAKHTG